jgi:hypothetical protein
MSQYYQRKRRQGHIHETGKKMNTLLVLLINEALLTCIQDESAEGNVFMSQQKCQQRLLILMRHTSFYSTCTEIFISTRPTGVAVALGSHAPPPRL